VKEDVLRAVFKIRRQCLDVAAIAGLLWVCVPAQSQDPFGEARQPPPPVGKAGAAFDLTGYWVSVISQNWRLRMVVPPPGDYMGIAMTAEAKRVADAWDPAKDEAAGDQCKYYGAAAIMTLPGRLHITWQDDITLRMEIDDGTQTRTIHFGKWSAPDNKPSWQGNSVASWEPRRGTGFSPTTPRSRYLKIRTTNMLPGYLRKNGFPYSANAILTEDYDLIQEETGETWLVVTTVVEDPIYLAQPLILTAHFKKQSDNSGWDPMPCSARW
jgi:hypothetical protein